ncbi:MAG TPA: hypothetical protein VHY91_01855 [Pirellulales bacterium]|jgi:hypothetical protein|nr:hypothetical protein [Pirellulales bacterium]
MPLVIELENAASQCIRSGLQPAGPPRAAVRWLASLALACLVVSEGCITWIPPNAMQPEAAFAPLPIVANNPVLLPNQDRDLVFETVLDVIDDYFKVDYEIPVRLEGDVLVEGQISTFPRSGSTILEPWGRDAINFYERLEGTLQSIRRQALVRVIPAEGGFLVDIVVTKELEDVLRPETGSASRAANLRNDNSLRRYVDPVTGTQPTLGWIRLGRDVALEQKMLVELASRFGPLLPPAPPTMAAPGSMPPPGVILPPDWVPAGQGTTAPLGEVPGQTGAAPPVTMPPDAAPPPELPPPPGTGAF